MSISAASFIEIADFIATFVASSRTRTNNEYELQRNRTRSVVCTTSGIALSTRSTAGLLILPVVPRTLLLFTVYGLGADVFPRLSEDTRAPVNVIKVLPHPQLETLWQFPNHHVLPHLFHL